MAMRMQAGPGRCFTSCRRPELSARPRGAECHWGAIALRMRASAALWLWLWRFWGARLCAMLFARRRAGAAYERSSPTAELRALIATPREVCGLYTFGSPESQPLIDYDSRW